MTDKLYQLMDWADVEEVSYAESTEPKRILGPHLLEEGLLIQAYIPTAQEIKVKLPGKSYAMELADESGFFAVLIPAKKSWEEKLPHYTFHVTYDDGSEAVMEDPYASPSLFSEEDLSKFAAGIHYRIYQKMGAHPCEVGGIRGVHFAVWAPNAMRVSVVGDFNLWDGRRHMMQRLSPQSGVFELFIPRMPEGTLYKYEIKCRGHEPFLKTDPYGAGFELRPDTASIVRDTGAFAWTDEHWEAEKACASFKERPMSVYELHLGSIWRKDALLNEDGSPVNGSEFYNYRELAKKLSQYVKKQGYTHVELMPVMEHPLDHSWGYQVSGYYAPTSRHGTAGDFQYFVNHLHEEGIGVILDWVPGHFPRDSWGLSQFDGTSLYENPDPNRASHPHWGTLLFNYQRPEVANFLIANAFYWADLYHVDGIRMDAVASMLYLDYGRQGGNAPRNMYGGNENLEAAEFLKHLNSQFKKAYPGVMLVAEESTAWPNITTPVEDGGMGFDLKWNMGWMNDFLAYMQVDPFFRKNNYSQLTFSMFYNYSEDFQLVFSHDEVVHGKRSLLGKMPGQTFEEKAQNLRAAYGYFFTHPGKKLLFMAQDFAQFDEWAEDREIEWDLLEYPVHKGVQQFVRDMNEVYKAHPALWQLDFYPEGFDWINCTYKELSLLLFVRKTDRPEETILVVCNFDNIAHGRFRMGVPFPCIAKALISSDDRKYGGVGAVRKIEHKARKQEWDERAYSIELNIPAMSTTLYQLLPYDPETEQEERKAKRAAGKKEGGKAPVVPADGRPRKDAKSQGGPLADNLLPQALGEAGGVPDAAKADAAGEGDAALSGKLADIKAEKMEFAAKMPEGAEEVSGKKQGKEAAAPKGKSSTRSKAPRQSSGAAARRKG